MTIYVEIEVPVLGKVYDFKLESKETIGALLEEILIAISQKEQCPFGNQKETFILSFPEQNKLLHPQKQLKDYKIITGSRLLLV